MIIVVKILKEIGAVEIFGQWMAPLMGLVGLPGSMGLVWAATLIAGFYPGIFIFADLAATGNADSRPGHNFVLINADCTFASD